MPFTISVHRNPGYLRFDVAGPPSLKNYFDLIELAAKETAATGEKNVLVDLRGVTGRLSFTDQFFIGDVVADKLANLKKLATLVPDDPETYNSQKVAQRKGLNLSTFSKEEEAIEWVRGKTPDAGSSPA
jgi:hypothetical protein